jgi:site-specific recombinase XerC
MDAGQGEWVDRFLGHLAGERRLSRHTIDAYRQDLANLAVFGRSTCRRAGAPQRAEAAVGRAHLL